MTSSTSLELLTSGEEVVLDQDAGLPPLKVSSFVSNLAGTRLLYGGSDGELRCVDFYKWMSGGCGPLWVKKLDHGILSVAVNHDDSVCAVANGALVSFYSDSGDHLVNSTKGDMYLMDARKTRGHTATITCVCSDPDNNNFFTSGSIDGTIRTFDIDSPRQGVAMSIHSSTAYVPRAARGPRVAIRCLCYSISGKHLVVGGTEKGSILTWDRRTAYPGIMLADAHMSSVHSVLSPENDLLVSRCDDSVKLWDLRNFKSPVHQAQVPGGDSCGDLALSPDGLHLALGEVVPINPRNIKEGFKGSVRMFSVNDLCSSHCFKLKFPPVSISWTHELGQLFVACQDGNTWCRCSSDSLESIYLSRAKAAHQSKVTASSHQTVSVQPEVYPIDQLPDNLEEADDGTLKRRRVPREYKKPGAKEEPDLDYVSYGKTPVSYEDEDIVAKLRAMEGNPQQVASAATGIQRVPYKTDKFMRMYQKTQPELILDFTAPDTKEENMLQGVRKCPRCGIKICQCGYMDAQRE
ncbi:WD G-beta repeat-containing protein protein [Babesia ovis]|uniref:WD G-beta repeat-containing protein protein n=1 Tax=Babesia ovis TaxID=5869 RepID=A0A9W5TAT1_BABOV|nr:WD G-beta repeat-containing protein protein [Babesia ovis]